MAFVGRFISLIFFASFGLETAHAGIDEVLAALNSEDRNARMAPLEEYKNVEQAQALHVLRRLLRHYAEIGSLYKEVEVSSDESREEFMVKIRERSRLMDTEHDHMAAAIVLVLQKDSSLNQMIMNFLSAAIIYQAMHPIESIERRTDWGKIMGNQGNMSL